MRMAMHSVHLSRPREGVSTPREGVSRPREGVSYTLSHTIHLIHLTCNVKIHMCPSLWTYGLDVWAPFVKADTCKATRLDVSAPFVVCLFGCLPASLTVSDARACDRKEAPTGWAWTRWKRLWRSDKATYPFPSSSCRCPPCIAVPQDRVVDALLMWSSLSQCGMLMCIEGCSCGLVHRNASRYATCLKIWLASLVALFPHSEQRVVGAVPLMLCAVIDGALKRFRVYIYLAARHLRIAIPCHIPHTE